MNKSANILFRLLSAALGDETEVSLPADVDWKEVIDLSFDQGVAAIAVDGLSKVEGLGLRVEGLDLLDSPELEDLKYEWFGEVMRSEDDYRQQVDAISSLARTYAQSGISMMLLKGYGLGLNYPIPQHRPTGDIDVYLINDNPSTSSGQALLPVWKCGDEIIRKRGIKVDSGHEHHTTFQFQGQMVENHYDFINTKAHRDAPRIEAKLKVLAFKARRWWHNRWKHPLVYDEWLLPMLLTLAWSHLRRMKTIKD